MENTDRAFRILSDIGLNKYEAKVYLTLVSEGVSTAKNISEITGIPYGKVYEIINTLSYKGFSMILPSKPMKYTAISPKQVLFSSKNETLDKFRKIETDIVNNLEPLFMKNRQFTQPKSVFSLVNGRSSVVKKTEELINKANKNIHIQCSANSLSRLVLHKEALKNAADRDVKIAIAGITDESNKKEISSLGFCDVRQIKRSRSNFISVDASECLVVTPFPDDENIIFGRDTGMHILSSSFTSFTDNFFISSFNRAKKIDLSTKLR